jgi:regulatory protein
MLGRHVPHLSAEFATTIDNPLHSFQTSSNCLRSVIVDDRRFAEGVVRSLADGKRQGRRRVAAGLAAKGVDEALAADVLASHCDEEAERDRALDLARRLARSKSTDAPRLASRLVSKGFAPALAWQVAREVLGSMDTPSDEG